jgi:hypothetical protein
LLERFIITGKLIILDATVEQHFKDVPEFRSIGRFQGLGRQRQPKASEVTTDLMKRFVNHNSLQAQLKVDCTV